MENKNYPIIFVPGVFDSELFFDPELTKPAWPLKKSSLLIDFMSSEKLIDLEKEYAGLKFYTKKPTENSKVEPDQQDFGVANKWEKFSKAVMAAFPDRAVWFFPYDFRQLSTTSMVKFAEFLNTFSTPVDIICHSYGNNLLAAYISHYGGEKIHRAACLAPPFQGSDEIFLVPAGSSFMPCMGELAPSPKLNSNHPMLLKKNSEAEAVPATQTEYNEILVKFFGGSYVPMDFSGIVSHPGCKFAVGTDRLTPIGTTFTLDEKGNPYVSDFKFEFEGDGTVPNQSSDIDQKLKDRTTYFPRMGHSEFERNPAAWYWAMMMINSGNPPMVNPPFEKKTYTKVFIEGTTDVHLRKPYSMKDVLSNRVMFSEEGSYFVIGENRDLGLMVFEGTDWIIDIYSPLKKETISLTLQRFYKNGKMINEKKEVLTGRFIHLKLEEDGDFESPFVMDSTPSAAETPKLSTEVMSYFRDLADSAARKVSEIFDSTSTPEGDAGSRIDDSNGSEQNNVSDERKNIAEETEEK